MLRIRCRDSVTCGRLWTVEHCELEGRVYYDCEYEDRAGWAAVCAGAFGFCGECPAPGMGKVVRVKRSGDLQDVVTGLSFPTGMTFGPDQRLYVSNLGIVGGAAGQILRIDLPAVQ